MRLGEAKGVPHKLSMKSENMLVFVGPVFWDFFWGST